MIPLIILFFACFVNRFRTAFENKVKKTERIATNLRFLQKFVSFFRAFILTYYSRCDIINMYYFIFSGIKSREDGVSVERKLLIIGAGIYAVVAAEIAADMGCFAHIDFVDDQKKTTPTGVAVIGTTDSLETLVTQYDGVVVAIGNTDVRLAILDRLGEHNVISLVSPHAVVSPNAQLGKGCIVEPMAVIHAGCKLDRGCIVSAGAVINHASIFGEGVHVDCNATVKGYVSVPAKTKIDCGFVFG